MTENTIYESWAFYEDQDRDEASRSNRKAYEELKSKYKILRVDYEPTEEELKENDFVYNKALWFCDYECTIFKCPEELDVLEIALICDGGVLCFGFSGDRKNIIIYTD